MAHSNWVTEERVSWRDYLDSGTLGLVTPPGPRGASGEGGSRLCDNGHRPGAVASGRGKESAG